LKEVFCSADKFDLIFNFNSTAMNKTDVQQRLCNMTDEQYEELSDLLKSSISDDDLIEAVRFLLRNF
jgi:hypothetical protein